VRRGFRERFVVVTTHSMVVVLWELWCLSWEQGENLLLQLVRILCISKGIFMVIKLESGFLTLMFLVESQFDTFPSIIKLIPLLLYIEKIKMFIIPCHTRGM